MKTGKGDIPGQRRRHRDRYRGCRVCGLRGQHCGECDEGRRVVAAHRGEDLCLVVDGSFVPKVRERGEHSPGDGGAGLVLVRGSVRTGEVLATRACGFAAVNSSDAEFQAVIRGARWAPGVPIYTDVRTFPDELAMVNPRLVVRYLLDHDQCPAYHVAHRLSVEGRCRQAPESAGPSGPEVAIERAGKTRAERRRMGVDLLLEQAAADPAFDGNFETLAERMGWTSGKLWRENPAIKKAAAAWAQRRSADGT